MVEEKGCRVDRGDDKKVQIMNRFQVLEAVAEDDGSEDGFEPGEVDLSKAPPGLERTRETRQICTVTTGRKGWRRIGPGEITIDSAAE